MTVPTHDDEGLIFIRFMDFDEADLAEQGYPGHPAGRYVSLDDLERVAEEEQDEPLFRLAKAAREGLSLQQVAE